MTIYRTFLFAPGNARHKVEKSFTCGADAVVLDLEDAVAISEKTRAREILAETLLNEKKVKAYIRVNAVSSGMIVEDLTNIVSANTVPNIEGIVLPKVESGDDIKYLECRLSEIITKRCSDNNIEIIPFIETAMGLCNLREILLASENINRLFFGAVDFVTDIGAHRTQAGHELLYARSKLVIESRVAGIEPPIDTVYTDVGDIEGLRRDARIALEMGFQGKLVIHPNQVKPVNEIFSPTLEEVRWAQQVVDIFEQSEAKGNAAIKLNGKFIEYPIYEKARRLLHINQTIISNN